MNNLTAAEESNAGFLEIKNGKGEEYSDNTNNKSGKELF